MTHLLFRSASAFRCATALCAVTLVACSRYEATGPVYGTRLAMAQFERHAAADSKPAQQVSNSLAYEHTLTVELQKDSLPARIKAVRAACEARKEFACTLLDISLRTELEVPTGEIRMRLAPGGVEPMVEIAAAGGRIVARATHAEDLAEPIADTDRQLSLLSSHRDRLSEFLQRKDLKVEQVISLSKEISAAQTQIDTLQTQRANLRRRVDTELLTIDFAPPSGTYFAQQTPIADAIRSSGADFRDAIAQVIRFTAMLVPWLVIIIPGIVLLRIFWRSITRWLARREIR
jgi:Domain of unknown function (DUF4349)